MRIRRLELCGFKSFSDRTVFQFADGISCVVGPNGCGKSNVLDAIRWVLGEQNPRLLRGQGMDDVIFGGSSGRAATGVAEATLVLDNSDDTLGERFSQFPEVEVGRRLYRDGESAYQLNGVRCRLKDVVDLFMDTGVGARASSVIEQGKVVDLINSKPADRRALIDEAAGIVGYKARRHEAQRRLESTEQNLLRVGDLADELRRQANVLRRQAAKANRYRRLQAFRKESEVLLALAETRKQTDRYREGLERLTDLQGERDRLLEEERTAQVQLDAARDQLRNAGAAVDELKDRQALLRADVQSREQEREFCGREIAGAERRAGELVREREDSEARSRQLTDEAERLRSEQTSRQQELQFKSTEQEQREAEMAASDGALTGLLDRQKTLRTQEEGLTNRAASLKADMQGLEDRKADHARRAARLEGDRELAEARLAEVRAGRDELVESQREIEAEMTGQRTHLAEVADELDGRRAAWAAMMTAIEELTALARERDARRQSLDEVLSRFEGFGAGVRALMLRRDEADDDAGIVGTVADVLDVPAEFEQAVEAALGDALQAVFVRSREHGIDGIAYLARRDSGRTTFLPLDDLRVHRAEEPPDGESVVALAREVVSAPEEFRPAVDLLLGDTVIVRDLESALSLRDALEDSPRIVTLTGDTVEDSGALTGGAGQETGVLGQKRELRQVEAELADLRAEEADARSVVEEISKASDRLDEERRVCEARLHSLEVTRARLDGERQSADAAVQEAKRRRGTLREEGERVAGSIASLEQEREKRSRELEAAGEELRGVRQKQEQSAGEAAAVQRDLEHNRGLAFQARLDATAARERLESARARLTQIEERSGEVVAQLEREQREREEISERITALEESIRRLGEEAEKLGDELVESGEMVERAIVHRDQVAGSVREFEEQITQVRATRGSLEEQVQSATTQVALVEAELEHLRDDLRQGYDLHLKPVFAEMEREGAVELTLRGTLPRPLGEEEDGDDPDEAADEAEVAGAGDPADVDGQGIRVTFLWNDLLDEESLEQRRQKLIKVRIDLQRIGEINMAAPEAYQEVKAQHDRLREQMDDLEASIERIRRGISKLNRTSRERFAEAFDQVNEHFRDLYPRLTGGGQATLALTTPDDLLETGLEVHVQPPGKKLKAMGLLSGGEKAMAALSLLFAVFLYRPSPFCLLDEVDAELDEANVRRLSQLLREMRERTQFLVISHTRRTMESADVLFGVTMEKPGISKLVSVKLEDVEVA